MVDEPTNTPSRVITLEQHEVQLRAAASAIVERFILARSMGMTHAGKRDVYGVLGYDETVTAAQYRDRYRRGGIAKRVVDAYPNAVWRGDGEVIEDEDVDVETEFEKQWWELNDQHRVWSMLQRTHVLASLGSFATILIGAQGDLASPLPTGKPGTILYLRPIGGGVINESSDRKATASTTDANIMIDTWDEDTKSKRFGLPLTYQLKNNNFTVPPRVHWTRLVHVPAPGFLDDDVFGPPCLEDVWNYLIDLDKVSGGGAEAFWMRANAGTQFDIDKKMTMNPDPKQAEAELVRMQEQIDAYVHQMSRVFRTRGVNVNQLSSDVADFSGAQDAILTLIAGTKGIPKRILTGSEMGKLASEQDSDNWNDQVKDCRTSYAHPVILRPFIERLIEYGYLVKPVEWQPKWPETGAMSDEEKISAAKNMVALNDNKLGDRVVTVNEVREFMGREAFTDAELATHADEAAARKAPAPVAEGDDPEAERVDKLEAALRKSGSITIAVT